MKKFISLLLALSLIGDIGLIHAEDVLPATPMTIWGSIRNGSADLPVGTKVEFYDGSGSMLLNYTLTNTGMIGGASTGDLSPTLNAFSGNLSMKVVSGGITHFLEATNINDSLKTASCPGKNAIAFVSDVCRYDLNLMKTVDPSSQSQVLTGSFLFSGATSTGVTYGSGLTLTIRNGSGSDSVILPTEGLTITASGGAWDGIFNPPVTSSGTATGAETGYIFQPNIYKIGSDVAELKLTGTSATVSLAVSPSLNATNLKIYRSVDKGVSYVYLATCFVSNSTCSFATSQFSVFAIAEPTDTIPDTFSFSVQTGQDLNISVQSTAVPIVGVNAPTAYTVTNGEAQINGSLWTTSGSLFNGDYMRLRLTTSSLTGTTVTATVTVGTYSTGFSVTTRTSIPAITSTGLTSTGLTSTGLTWTGIISTGTILTGSTDPVSDTGSIIFPARKNTKKYKKFSDVEASFAKADIEEYTTKGILKGFSDGTFRPNNPITRAEFLGVAFKALGIKVPDAQTTDFTDVDVDWIRKNVEAAKMYGIKGQEKDGKKIFRPNDPITRIEALAILFKIASISTDTVGASEFDDVKVEWMMGYVKKAKEKSIISGQEKDGLLIFRPGDSITRAESVRIIKNTVTKR